ncbi:MAG: hypothetical protein GXO07_05365 [Crenarchaeota archaeon]|nr:hypothetical protein [Thermoproteota archaeon]
MSLTLSEILEKKLPKKINSIALIENETLAAASDDGCVYIIDWNGNEIARYCGKAPMTSVAGFGDRIFVGSRGDAVYVLDTKGDLLETVRTRYSEVISPVSQTEFVGCSDACAKLGVGGSRGWVYDIGHVGKDIAVGGDKVYVPDAVWRKVHEVDLDSGNGSMMISFKDRPFSVDFRDGRLLVGTSRGIALFNGTEEWWTKPLGPQVTLAKFLDDYIVAVNLANKKLVVLDMKGSTMLEKDLPTKPSALAVSKGVLAVGFYDGTLKVFEVHSFKEEAVPEVEELTRTEADDEISQLREIAEGSYLGTPVAKEIIAEISEIVEELEGGNNISDMIRSVLMKVEELTNTASADWRQVYANYEEAERMLEGVLEVIKRLRERIGEVSGCPPPEDLLEILRLTNVKEFTRRIAELAPEGTDVKERVKAGARVLKRCLERYYLLPSSEEIAEVEKMLEDVKQQKEVVKALLESGL